MKLSWRLGRVFGIDVFLHATFLILLAWIGFSQYSREGSVKGALVSVTFTLMVFTIVVMHELGHALTARAFGIRTRDITLLPIGGVARLERMPEKPQQELLVALAGPAVNVALAVVLYVLLRVTNQPLLPEGDVMVDGAPMLTKLLWVNVSLAVFNLLPAFPMDGGRVVRALLAMRGDYVKATRRAANLGKAIALGFGLIGFFHNPVLVLIAWFVWAGASSEADAVETKAILSGVSVDTAMMTDFRSLSVHDTLATASSALLAGSQMDFPVLDDRGSPAGVLTRRDLVRGLSEGGADQLVGATMTPDLGRADPKESLVGALQRLREHPSNALAVVDREGALVGLLTSENIGELMLLQEALRTARQHHRGRA